MTKDSTHPGGFVPTALAKEMAVCSLTSDRATAAMEQETNMDSGEWVGFWGKLRTAPHTYTPRAGFRPSKVQRWGESHLLQFPALQGPQFMWPRAGAISGLGWKWRHRSFGVGALEEPLPIEPCLRKQTLVHAPRLVG